MLFCPTCRKNVIPIKKIRKRLFIERIQLTCPICGNCDLKPCNTEEIQGDVDCTSSIPSLEYFIEWYNAGDYYKALKIEKDAPKEVIRSAIDAFQIEHIDSAPEWSIPLANIKEHLLNRKEPLKSDGDEHSKVDRRSWVKALPYFQKAEEMESQGRYIEAMEACTKAIEIAPTFFPAYLKRAWNGLLSPDYKHFLNQIIDDCSNTIRYDLNNWQAYNDRGRAYARKGDLEMASRDYHQSLMFNPNYTIAALNAMEADICLGKYRLAVGTFGVINRDVATPTYIVIAHSLVCTALALDGKEYVNKIGPLNDKTIRIRNLVDWCTVEIDHNLEDLEQRGYDDNRLKNAKYIHSLFKEHFD